MSESEARRAAVITAIIGFVALVLGLIDLVATGSGLGLVAMVGGVLMIIAAALGLNHNRPQR
jgi:uncharacterized membrane protein HdeD (DUF308 family)